MRNKSLNNRNNCRNRPGIVLLVTLVLLVMLSALGYTLSSRLAAQHHREQYIIDYQAARYGCDSAARYAFAKLQDINTPQLVDRPNEPDFSDLFALSEVEYKELLAKWAAEKKKAYSGTKNSSDMRDAMTSMTSTISMMLTRWVKLIISAVFPTLMTLILWWYVVRMVHPGRL